MRNAEGDRNNYNQAVWERIVDMRYQGTKVAKLHSAFLYGKCTSLRSNNCKTSIQTNPETRKLIEYKIQKIPEFKI